MNSVPNVAEILSELECNAPHIYAKGMINVADKRGNIKKKKCIINLATGDIFKNRALAWSERARFCFVKRHADRTQSIEEIYLNGHHCAQVVDGNVVLTTWVFADSYNNPRTTKVDWSWYGDEEISLMRRGEKVDDTALFNVKLSTPRIASIAVVTPNKDIHTWDNIEEYGLLDSGRYRYPANKYLSEALMQTLTYATYTKDVVNLRESFKEVFNVGYLGANKYVTFDSPKDIPVFMKAPKLVKKCSTNQTRIDNLVAMKIPDHSIAAECDNTICYADKVSDEWTVLRWYRKIAPAQYVETSRMYVNKTEALHCRNNLYGDWVFAGAKIKSETFKADKICLQSDDVFDGTKLEYFKNVSTDSSNRSAALYMLTMYPEFEKMCKSGLEWLCELYIADPYQQSWKNSLEEMVGHVDWKTKNVLKMIGVNRHQVDKIAAYRTKMIEECDMRYWERRTVNNIIHKLKSIFCVESLSSIDNATFDYIVDSIDSREKIIGCYTSCLTMTFELYHNDAMYFIRDLNHAMQSGDIVETRTRHGYRSQMTVDRLYLDTIRMIHSGGYHDVLRPRFSTVEELIGHHEVMTDLINADQKEHEARQAAQFEQSFAAQYEKWKKFEWDEDDAFCIVAPTQPLDIAVEGITLRHCVKSYIPSVAAGNTNIVFIRVKGKEEEPFFTVEVDLRNNIRQVHGMCNSNVSSVSGLADFVKRWSKAKKLKYSQEYANVARVAG